MSIESTAIVPQMDMLKFDFEKMVDVMKVFNDILLSPIIPFVSCLSYFKSYNSFKPPISWIEENNFCRIWTLKGAKVRSIDVFPTHLIIQSNALDILSFIQDMVKLKDDSMILSSKSVFYVYGMKKYNEGLFLDYIMNEVGRRYTIKESSVLVKKRKTIRLVHSPTPDINIELNINFETLEQGNDLFKTPFWKSVGPGNVYLRVTMIVSDSLTKKGLVKLKDSIVDMIQGYSDEADELKEIYEDLGVKVMFEKGKKVSKNPKITYMDGEMFPTGYSTFCQVQQGQQPTYVSKEEGDQMLEDGEALQVLEFPLAGDHGQIPIDSEPRYFVCKNDKHPYPGLKPNTELDNKELFPYLPCCYGKDQNELKGSGLWNYLRNIRPGINRNEGVANITVKGKIQLKAGVKGSLSRSINDMLLLFKSDRGYQRLGVSGTINDSFLTCLNNATNMKLTRDDISKYYTVSIQENWNIPLDKIRDEILNEEVYLNPLKYIRVLEVAFGVKIFLFDVENDEGTFAIPNHTHGYLSWFEPEKPFVMIFLSKGSKGKRDEICELIIDEQSEKSLFTNAEFHSLIHQTFYRVHSQYIPFRRYSTFRLDGLEDVVSQFVDSYGKTRLVEFPGGVVFSTPPLPILPVKINEELEESVVKNPEKVLAKFPNYDRVSKEFGVVRLDSGIPLRFRYGLYKPVVNVEKFIDNEKGTRLLIDVACKKLADTVGDVNEDSIITFFDRYVELGKYIPAESAMYKNARRVVVDTEIMKDRLLYWVNLMYTRLGKSYFDKVRSMDFLPSYYKSITDFDKRNGEIIINGVETAKSVFQNVVKLYDEPMEKIENGYFVIGQWTCKNGPVLTVNMNSVENAIRVHRAWATTGNILVSEELMAADVDGKDATVIDYNKAEVKGNGRYIVVKRKFRERTVYCPMMISE